MSSLLAVLLSAAAADPLPILVREGFRLREFPRAVVAVPPLGDPRERSQVLYDRYLAASRAVEDRLTLSVEEPVTLVECASKSSFGRVVGELAGSPPPRYAVAVAIPEFAAIVVDRTSFQSLADPEPSSTIAHEAAHLALHRAFRRIPRWLDEGLAMWGARQEIAPHEVQTLRYWAARRGAMSFSNLLNEFPRGHRPAAFAYVQSLSVTCYLIEDRGGLKRIFRLLALNQRQDLRAAWLAAYGEAPEVTLEAWRRFEAGRLDLLQFMAYEVPAFSAPAALFLLAYVRYRVRRRRFFREEEERERAAGPQGGAAQRRGACHLTASAGDPTMEHELEACARSDPFRAILTSGGHMRRFGLAVLVASLLASCGRKQQQQAIPSVTPESRKEHELAILAKARKTYEDTVLPNYREDYTRLRQYAWQYKGDALRLGDEGTARFFLAEIDRIEREFRSKAVQIRDRARTEAELKSTARNAPEDIWDERGEIWNRCAGDLEKWQYKLREQADSIRELIVEAERERDRAALLQKAYLRFTGTVAEANGILQNQSDAEGAVALLAIFRAWLASKGLVGEAAATAVADGGPPPQGGDGYGAPELVRKVEELIASYEKKLISEPTGKEKDETLYADALAKLPWEEVSADEFLIHFTWASGGGECQAEGDSIVADGGDGGGRMEAPDPSWGEFEIEFQVQIVEGKQFWLAARPQVAAGSDRSEYRRKVRVELSKETWHRLRVQAQDDKLSVFELPEGGQPKPLAKPIDLLPVGGRNVKGGFMIGLEPNTKIELKGVRFKVLEGEEKVEEAEKTPAGGEEKGKEGGGEGSQESNGTLEDGATG